MCGNRKNLTSVYFLDDLATSTIAASLTRKCTYSSGKVLTQFRGEASITGIAASSNKSLIGTDQVVMKVKLKEFLASSQVSKTGKKVIILRFPYWQQPVSAPPPSGKGYICRSAGDGWSSAGNSSRPAHPTLGPTCLLAHRFDAPGKPHVQTVAKKSLW